MQCKRKVLRMSNRGRHHTTVPYVPSALLPTQRLLFERWMRIRKISQMFSIFLWFLVVYSRAHPKSNAIPSCKTNNHNDVCIWCNNNVCCAFREVTHCLWALSWNPAPEEKGEGGREEDRRKLLSSTSIRWYRPRRVLAGASRLTANGPQSVRLSGSGRDRMTWKTAAERNLQTRDIYFVYPRPGML